MNVKKDVEGKILIFIAYLPFLPVLRTNLKEKILYLCNTVKYFIMPVVKKYVKIFKKISTYLSKQS
jgi:hypothetical protein